MKKYIHNRKGFILPLTLLITTIILAVATGITTVLTKELLFSKLSRESHMAYYSADSGLACALYIDDAYVDQSTGMGIFQHDDTTLPQDVLNSVNTVRTERGIPNIPSIDDIKCASTPVFVVASSSISVTDYGTPVTGKTTTFTLRMDLGDSTYRCARVTVNKTATFRQIISRGYNTCDFSSPRLIERAVVNTTQLN
jgi:hypothetical protein